MLNTPLPSAPESRPAAPPESRARTSPAAGRRGGVGHLSPARTAAKPERMAQALHVVVADADPASARLFEQALLALGHQTFVAGTGREFVAVCQSARPALAIVALRLPDGDGLRAAEEAVRDHPLPVILTCAPDDAAAAGAVEA